MVLGFVLLVGAIWLISAGLSALEFRRMTPLAFHCHRCDADFVQAPHLDYPKRCARCKARDWSA